MSPLSRLALIAFVVGCCFGAWALQGQARLEGQSGVREPETAREGARANARQPSSARAAVVDDSPALDSAASILAVAEAERERMTRDRALYRELKSKAERTSLESHMLRNLEETNRYPPGNQRFPSQAHDPIARRNAPDHRSKRSEDGRTTLTVWMSANQIDLGGKAQVFATVSELDAKATAGRLRQDAKLSLTLTRDGQPTVLAELALSNDGRGQYSATIDTESVAGHRLEEGFYIVHVKGPEQLKSMTAFGMRPAYAALTGNYRDTIKNGALVIEAEVEAYEAGRFLVLATAYTDDDIPLGTTQVAAQLEAGTSWVALPFHGLMVRDGGRPGPYRLAHISVEKQSFPLLTGVSAAPNYRTRPYALSEFASEPYNRLDVATGEDEGE